MALVFNIQKYSIHDGPGIRTTVFFKGCPLKCLWCHNPESQSFKRELMVYRDRCISCGGCNNACPNDAINNKEQCTLCESCSEDCPTNARVMVGKEMSVEEIIKEVEKDRVFYDQSNGGVTLSGGEPLSQGQFLVELARELKKRGLHVVLDTSGYGSAESLIEIVPYIDLFLYDLKLVNDEKHRFYTGVTNRGIIDNLKTLAAMGNDVIIRIPIIPGINNGIEDIKDFIGLLKELGCFTNINLLPYHNISLEKYNRLDRRYELNNIKAPDALELEKIKHIFEGENFKVKIGG